MLQGGDQRLILPTLPKVENFSEVYDYGTVCKISYKENLEAALPYTMMLVPTH
jgi:hypothetical protein